MNVGACCQEAYQLIYIKEMVCIGDCTEDHRARALKTVLPIWLRSIPSEVFDTVIYDDNPMFIQSRFKGVVLYSTVGNAFIFSSDGRIFWFEYDEYQIAKRYDGGFCCPELTIFEIGSFRFEIIEALSTITPTISNSYCNALKSTTIIQ